MYIPWTTLARHAYLVSVHSDGHSESSRETKVGKFDISRCIKQKILWFQVAVQDTMTMTEENALQQLVNIALTEQQTSINQSLKQREIYRAPLYDSSRSASNSQL